MNYTKIECGQELPTEPGTYFVFTELSQCMIRFFANGKFKEQPEDSKTESWLKPLPEQPVDYELLSEKLLDALKYVCDVSNEREFEDLALEIIEKFPAQTEKSFDRFMSQESTRQASPVVKLPSVTVPNDQDYIEYAIVIDKYVGAMKQLNPHVKFE